MLVSKPPPRTSLGFPLTLSKRADILRNVEEQRQAIKHALSPSGLGERLLVIIGPCSIHDTAAGMDYARRLAAAAEKHKSEILVAMRVYIEKPRTTVGWKGLVHDPDLTQSQCSDIDKGLRASRDIMVRVAELGLPVVTEMLSPLVIPFLDDVLAMGVIGARTTESQTHRELASDVPFPVGFKNGTDGSLGVAIDAIKSSERQHTLLGVSEDGGLVQKVSPGNPDTFVVLRGGKHGPNYASEHVREAQNAMTKAGKPVRLVIDCSHGNSSKDYRNQGKVAACVGRQVAAGAPVAGLMIESNIRPGEFMLPDIPRLALQDTLLTRFGGNRTAGYSGLRHLWPRIRRERHGRLCGLGGNGGDSSGTGRSGKGPQECRSRAQGGGAGG